MFSKPHLFFDVADCAILLGRRATSKLTNMEPLNGKSQTTSAKKDDSEGSGRWFTLEDSVHLVIILLPCTPFFGVFLVF